MHWSLSSLLALALLGIALAMILLEVARNKTRPPFPASKNVRSLYWITYLSCLVLGSTLALATVIRY